MASVGNPDSVSPSSIIFLRGILSNRMTSSKCPLWGKRSTGMALRGMKGSPGKALEVGRARATKFLEAALASQLMNTRV